jgi:hypothetical protein
MANTAPRRPPVQHRPKQRPDPDAPWTAADPSRKVAINVPFAEPVMAQLDFLVENRMIFSKASFIRDTVAAAAEAKINEFRRMQEAMRRMDEAEQPRPARRRRPTS